VLIAFRFRVACYYIFPPQRNVTPRRDDGTVRDNAVTVAITN